MSRKLKELPKIIWGNIIFLIYIIAALLGGVVSRHQSPEWQEMKDIRMEYDLLFGSLAILCAGVIIGLLLRKEWGRQLAISINFILFFSSAILRAAFYLFSKVSWGEGILVIDLDAIAISILSLFFLVALTRQKVKTLYLINNIEQMG